MKGIEKLILTAEQKKLLETSELQYRRFARIYFEVISVNAVEAVIKVWQNENPVGKYLPTKELIDRAKTVFEGILPAGVKIHCRPIPFQADTLKSFTIADVKKKMQIFGLQPKDLVKLLDIDKSSLSLILSGDRELSKGNRAMFYYFFKHLEYKAAS